MARIPIDIGTGKLKDPDIIVGIDLGTTNSLIAKVTDGQPQTIADYDKGVIVPSIIHFGPSITVGEEARQFLTTDPQNTIYSVKRLMGKSYLDVKAHAVYFGYELMDEEADGIAQVKIDGRTYTAVELSAMILAELKRRAEHRLKQPILQAVITVPAYFNDAQRQATRDAGKLAGLDVLRIVNEPTAASLAYGVGLSPEEHKTIAVYDLGGGTFDVTILRLEAGIFEVLATNGDTYLGGDDFDRLIMDDWIAKQGWSPEAVLAEKDFAQQLRLAAEGVKKELTSQVQAAVSVEYQGKTVTLGLDVTTFERLIEPMVARTMACCRAAMKDAGVAAVDEVILVGGSTRTPFVKKSVAELFDRTPLDHLNPDEVVALGAAVQANILGGKRKDLLLLDVTPLSLGVETVGGLMDVLIPRNAKIPTRVTRAYTTSVDGQVNMRISVFQGERELVSDNRKLAEFDLRGIPAMPAGLPKVELTFMLDADGILRVEAVEARSGVRQQVVVQPKYGLTDGQVEEMLLASLQNAQNDMAHRLLVETQEKARQMIYFSEKFLNQHRRMMDEKQHTGFGACLQTLKACQAGDDRAAIVDALEALDAYARPFTTQLMDEAVKASLQGKSI